MLVCPVKIVTLAGTDSAAVLLARLTDIELPAAALNETVQLLDALLPSVDGVQEIPVSCACAPAVSPKDCDAPL